MSCLTCPSEAKVFVTVVPKFAPIIIGAASPVLTTPAATSPTITDVETDVTPTKLSLPYGVNATSTISVDSTEHFTTFENAAVGETNPGYLKMGDEIIKYTGASGGSITGITRGNNPKAYIKGTPVRKYELAGVSLGRINKTHLLSEITDRDPAPITFDSYTIKIDTGADSSGDIPVIDRSSADSALTRPRLYFNDTRRSLFSQSILYV